jgi:cyclic-di-GMP-binding protein
MELRIPTLKKPGTGIFKTNPESIRRWVENLPLANIDTTIGRLDYGLSEINSVELSPGERTEALELLTPPVIHITGALQKKYLGKRFPLGKDYLDKSDQTIGLYLAMATGYKLLVAALDRGKSPDPRIAIAMQRAIHYLGESLIASYQVYRRPREGIWADLHTLYALSVKYGLQAHQEIDTTLQKPAPATAETAYKQILLLSLASPYRLRQGDIRLVYNLLGQWATFSRLHVAKARDNLGFFACDLTSDDPPSYLLLRHRDHLDENWRILDTSSMTAPVHAALARLHDRSSLKNILPGQNTMKRLLLAWGVMPERQTVRKRREAPVRLVLGINAIHRLLSEPASSDGNDPGGETRPPDEEDFLRDPTLEQPTVINTSRPSRGGTAQGTGIWSNGSADPRHNPMKGAFAVDRQSAMDGKVQAPAIESWKMVNASAGGYCLLRESEDVSSAQVGELVAIGPDVDDDWQLGVIRWMRFTPERGLELGVELIASDATPVWVCLCEDKPAAGTRAQGLLLPESKTPDSQASLLLPSMPFRTGCLSTLTREEQEERIVLVRQIENTGSFGQFHFSSATGSRVS